MFVPRPRDLFATGPEGGGVAGNVQRHGRLITWVMPGGRERAYVIARTLPARRGVAFAFVDHRGRTFELRPLTAKLYNASVRRPGHPSYRTQRELQRAYQLSLG